MVFLILDASIYSSDPAGDIRYVFTSSRGARWRSAAACKARRGLRMEVAGKAGVAADIGRELYLWAQIQGFYYWPLLFSI